MSTAPSLVYTRSKRSTRAKSAHHSEASAKRELPWVETWISREKPAFNVGEEVEIVDDEHIHYKRAGRVHKHLGGTKYLIKMPWSGGFLPFQKSQLRALPKKTAPKRKRRTDWFSCPWGKYNLADYPDMPAKWAAYKAAGERFLAFMETLNRDIPLTLNTPAEWRAHMTARLATWAERRAA